MRIVLSFGRVSLGDALHLDFALQEISRNGVRLRLSPKVFVAAAALAVAEGPMTPGGMVEHLYGEQEGGGPERAESTVRVTVWQARRALKIFGVEVTAGAVRVAAGREGDFVDAEGAEEGMAWIPRRKWLRLHQVYLETEGWARTRQRVMKRCGGICEACRRARAAEVHHLSYAHWRSERLSELQGLCRKCHKRAHGGKR